MGDFKSRLRSIAVLGTAGIALGLSGTAAAQPQAPQRPNIVLIITDDQGYGDVGVNRNPAVRTPNIDKLHAESVRLDNFHVDPTCSPTRAALLTGQYSLRAGVWHTVMGRSLMPTEKVTMAERLRDAGYATGIFGKWHLGDNYPFRPQDQGFQHTVIHQGGGVGQIPDYWGNTQKDGSYFVDGKPVPFKGWSTDIWFDEATKFIRGTKGKPFFAYIATNAPHAPYRANAEEIAAYTRQGLPPKTAAFYAMISHIDERVGRLRQELVRQGLDRNTIFVWMTDNGTSMTANDAKGRPELPGWDFNGGMRGTKNEVYEGGHRVPFYIRWPAGGLGAPRDIRGLTAHIDIAPTLLDLAGVDAKIVDFDGISLAPQLRGGNGPVDRTLFVTNQRVDIPSLARPEAVLTERWRLIVPGGGKPTELYDIAADPGQKADVAAANPGVVARLTYALKAWWDRNAPRDAANERQRIIVGSPRENPSRLSAMDWMEAGSEAEVPWFPGFQRPGEETFPPSWLGREDKYRPLPWYLSTATTGSYRISAWLHDTPAMTPINRKFALFEIDGRTTVVPVTGLSAWSELDVPLAAGPHNVRLWFANDAAGKADVLPAFFAYIDRRQPGASE